MLEEGTGVLIRSRRSEDACAQATRTDLRASRVGRRIRSLVAVANHCARRARMPALPRGSGRSTHDRNYAVTSAVATNAAIAAANSRLLSSQA